MGLTKAEIDEELDESRDFVDRVGTFSVSLVSSRMQDYDDYAKLPAHKNVIRPLLKSCSECWAYGITPRNEVYRTAKEILELENGRYRVRTEGDPVTNRELFWNANAGRRGTIVFLIPYRKFAASDIFQGGYQTFVATNFLTGHTPAAVRFARKRVALSDVVAICLPRNNGTEWMDVFAKPRKARALFETARQRCRWR